MAASYRPRRIGLRLRRDASAVENARAGRVQRLLEVHAPIQQIGQDLHLPLRLHVGAHAAEGHCELANRVGQHGGQDGVAHALAGRGNVRVIVLQFEVGTAIVQRHPGTGHVEAGAEHIGNAGDERDRIAVLVRSP